MNEEQIQQELENMMKETGKNVSRIARLINDEDAALAKLKSEEARELVSSARIRMAEAVQKGSYDDFAFAVSVLCHAGVLKGGRDKWKQLPIITDYVWRECRDALKGEIANAVDELINQIQEG
jgi:phosphoribosyl-ATP pyrophosphohydrolase